MPGKQCVQLKADACFPVNSTRSISFFIPKNESKTTLSFINEKLLEDSYIMYILYTQNISLGSVGGLINIIYVDIWHLSFYQSDIDCSGFAGTFIYQIQKYKSIHMKMINSKGTFVWQPSPNWKYFIYLYFNLLNIATIYFFSMLFSNFIYILNIRYKNINDLILHSYLLAITILKSNWRVSKFFNIHASNINDGTR